MDTQESTETVKKIWKWKSFVVAGASIGLIACGAEQADENVVARVGSYRLTVDQAVELLVDQESLPADVGVVQALAELWVDYTLLADAAARDSTFSDLDLDAMVLQQVSQSMVFQLRDSVIQVDTFITDDELRSRYEAEAPALEVRARHIMFQLPIQATAQQQDSVRQALVRVRERVAGGESFETLARQFSQDPGSAAQGGDLGFFGRGDMVAPFENAAMALEPGEVSDVVRTPMGLHLIRLEERRVRAFDEMASGYRRQVQARMVQEAESTFVAALVEEASPQVAEGALDIVREIAGAPGSRLAGRGERRPLVEWTGDAVTVGDVREILQLESPQLRDQVAAADDEEVADFLESLARRELLIRAAAAEGLRPSRDSLDVLVGDARAQLRQATRMLGLLQLDRAPGEDLEVAVARAVEGALSDVITGAAQVVPLGIVGFELREGRSVNISGDAVGQVILSVAEIRAARQLSPVEETVLDSVGAALDGAGR
jgi:parvulin-like peptidyl-prolyl isomerase